MIPHYQRPATPPPNEFDDALNGLRAAVSMKSSDFGTYASINSLNTSVDDAMNDALNGIDSATDAIDKSIDAIPIPDVGDLSDVADQARYKAQELNKSKSRGLIPSLIQILLSVIKIPTRFDKVFGMLSNGGTALGEALAGLGKSGYLGIKDLIILVMAIVKVIVKYWKCVLSFWITTFYGGCFIFHPVTLLFYILYLIFPITAYIVWSFTTFDLNPYIDTMFEEIDRADEQFAEMAGFHITKWPDVINQWCYTCFFQEVKLKDVLKDIMVVKDIGDMITRDFNEKMPMYFRPAKKHALLAKRNMDAVVA